MGFRYDDSGTGAGVTFAPPSGQIDVGDANNEGASGSAARADHQHSFPSPTGAPPALADTGSAGTGGRPSRQNHTHAHTAAHHRSGGHADLTGDFAAIDAPSTAVANHEGAADPHPGYTTAAELNAGVAAANDYTDTEVATRVASATLATSGKGFVAHGSDDTVARPAGYASVEWFGTVEPTNWVSGDTWNDPS